MSNIADVKKNGLWITRLNVGDMRHYTKSGRVWLNMIQRSTPNSPAQVKQPSYVGCTVSENFKDFQYFVQWHQSQIGYDQPAYELDKDILIVGNKHYSEDNCLLVPSALNNFFVANNVRRGEYPLGVSFHKQSGRYQAQIRINMRNTYLGIYDTPEEAHAVYVQAKEQEAGRWYGRLKSGEFIVDKRLVDAVDAWRINNG